MFLISKKIQKTLSILKWSELHIKSMSLLSISSVASVMCRKEDFILFFNQPSKPGIRGKKRAHMCADRTVGAEGQPAGLCGTCSPPRVSFKDTETIGVHRSPSASVTSYCRFEQQSLGKALPLTCREWWDSFLLLLLATCPNGGGFATGLLYYCTSSETRLT